MKKFELYEQYLEQGIVHQRARQRYDEKVTAAEKALTDAKIKLDEVVHAEMASGVDKTAEKASARKVIEQAEKNVEYALEERAIAYAHFDGADGNITKAEVVQAYLNEYVPAVKAEHFPSIQARMRQGADLMLSAFYDFTELRREYHEMQTEIKDVNDAAHKMGEQQGSYYIDNPFSVNGDSGLDINKLAWQLQDIAGGDGLPAEATYIKNTLKGDK
ncbi:hypothetical protein P4597_18940 [Peribacillus simplex]|uniref:hypothetical protein n=1 Tax=Peribacillus simplex TaxID=1478 RepID=UPI002E22626A|nr:hypothetical protein [Peribacillus simplex]